MKFTLTADLLTPDCRKILAGTTVEWPDDYPCPPPTSAIAHDAAAAKAIDAAKAARKAAAAERIAREKAAAEGKATEEPTKVVPLEEPKPAPAPEDDRMTIREAATGVKSAPAQNQGNAGPHAPPAKRPSDRSPFGR